MKIQVNKKEFNKNKIFLGLTLLAVVLYFVASALVNVGINSGGKLPEIDNASGDYVAGKLIINELMTSNSGAFADETGNTFDWIELYNGTDSDINLKNYGLSKKKNTTQWYFSDATIKAKDYLVVYMSGKNTNGLYANFKLSSGGNETLVLRSPSGNNIDAVKTSEIRKNWVMARDESGTWFTTNNVTPGFANTKEGRIKYVESLKVENESGLIISEFLPKNKGNFIINNGLPGFVEIQNTSSNIVNLGDFTLSGDVNTPFRYKLPDINLAPNDFFTLYLADVVSNVEPYFANWTLSNIDGVCILGTKGKVVQMINYSSLPNGNAFVYQEGNYYQTGAVSPGYSNDAKGIEGFAKAHLKAPSDLIVNEIMGSNYQYLPQNGGNYYDWIEIKNNSNSEINLKDYTISNNYSLPSLCALPDMTLKPGEMVALIASGNSALTTSKYIHLNFKIGNNEGIFIFKAGKYVDSLYAANIPVGYSYGRSSNGGFGYMAKPSPLAENVDGLRDVSNKPVPSQAAGVYNGVGAVEVSFKSPGTLYYTTNGSTPTSRSSVYKGPFSLSRTTVLKVISVEHGKVVSPVGSYSYIVNEKHTLPVVSLVLDKTSFSKMRLNRSGQTEAATSVEYFDTDGQGFSIDCGIQLFGGQTRFMSKQSFSLHFKKRYGSGKLEYPIFPNRDYAVFDQVVLRSSSQDHEYAMIRDTVAAAMNIKYDTKCAVQDYRYVVLYVNGGYYGVYNFREKLDDIFVANQFNVSPEGSNLVRNNGKVSAGSYKGIRDLKNYISDASMSTTEAFNYVAARLNMESFADFWVGAIYSTNNDMVNYRFMNNPKYDDGRYHTIFYDLDWAFYNYRRNYFISDMKAGSLFDGSDTIISRGLMKNQKFKNILLDRLVYGLHNQWKKENVLAEIERQYQLLKPEMAREKKRWGGTVSEWENSVNEFRDYVKKRNTYLLPQIKSTFNLSSEKMKELFGDL